MLLTSCSASCPALQPLSKAVGRVRQTLPAENKSHFSKHGCQYPAEMLKFTWTPGGCRQQDCKRLDATFPVTASMLGLGWQSCHGQLSILTMKWPHTQ